MGSLNGKAGIITGSSQGIGKALALELARKGAKVVINGRSAERLNETYQFLSDRGYEVAAIQGDVSNFQDCQNLIEQAIHSFGKIDFLINNAGLATEGVVENTHPDLFKKILEVNYLGSVYPTKAALPHIRASRGSILFVSSLAGIHGLPEYSIYSSSKMALTAFAESLRKELDGSGVHIGIAYVGFTLNDPGKTIYNESGELEPIPERKNVKVEPVDKVARRLARMIENRTYKSTFSTLGKLLLVLNRFFPFAVEAILTYLYRKRKPSGNRP